MIWTLYYLAIIIPCVCSLDEDLSNNNLFKIDSDDEVESDGLTTLVTERDSLLVTEGLQNISDSFLENWTDGGQYDSQDNRTQLDIDDVEILRSGDVLSST